MLNELSSQGLEVWRDEQHAWQWRWTATEFQSECGFWALGEAIVDAVVTLSLRTIKEVRAATGAGGGCTCCHKQIRELLEVHIQASLPVVRAG